MGDALTNINIVLTAANVIIAGFNAVLTYYSVRRSDRIAEYSQLIEIIKKSDILMKIHDQGNKEIIEITNRGENPVSKTELKITMSIKKVEELDEIGQVKFVRDIILQSTESFRIPLHEKLEEMLLDSKFIRVREEEIPTGEKDPWSEEDIFIDIYVRQLFKNFNLAIQIELNYKVFQEELVLHKHFELQYRIKPDYHYDPMRYQYEDNYDIIISEISGEWGL